MHSESFWAGRSWFKAWLSPCGQVDSPLSAWAILRMKDFGWRGSRRLGRKVNFLYAHGLHIPELPSDPDTLSISRWQCGCGALGADEARHFGRLEAPEYTGALLRNLDGQAGGPRHPHPHGH